MTIIARNVMHGPAITLTPETTLHELQRVMAEHRIHGVPVVDAQGGPVGIVTSTDLLAFGLDQDESEPLRPAAVDYLAELLEYAPDEARDLNRVLEDRFAGRTVSDLMTRDLVTVDVEAPISEAAEAMSRHQIHRVVVTEHGRVCGIISSLDLVALLARGV